MQIFSKSLVLIYKICGLAYKLSALANDCDSLCNIHYYFCIIVTMNAAKSVMLISVQRNVVFIVSCFSFFSVFQDF